MATTNRTRRGTARRTHEGAPAVPAPNALAQLRRSVLACLLWEDQFYEDGTSIADRIKETAAQVSVDDLAALCVEARTSYNLRHAPLWLLVSLIARGRGNPIVASTIQATIQRADEITELLSLYWQANPKRGARQAPLSAQMKKGLSAAFQKFDAYQLAKYNREKSIKLRDALFLCHAEPRVADQTGDVLIAPALTKGNYQRGAVKRHANSLLTQLVHDTLAAPGTWEERLSAGEDAKTVFTELLTQSKLGYLALLRNLRNMQKAKVDDQLVRAAILARRGGAERVLPFRYVAAARAVPSYEAELDEALSNAVDGLDALDGLTAVLVDVSGSMTPPLSAKSDLTRRDAAATLASIIPGKVRVWSFSDYVVEVPPRRGMAGVDAINKSQPHNGTYLGAAIEQVTKQCSYDRLIVVSDEQSHDALTTRPTTERAYLINVASYQNGVSYGRPWQHLDGFSENVIRWIAAHEKTTSHETE